MKTWFTAVWLLASITTQASDIAFTRQDKFQGVTVESGKSGKVRAYRASFVQTINAPLHEVKAGIVNFSEKCNNQHRLRRQWVDASVSCAFTNTDMIETRVERNLRPQAPLQGETDRYVLSRRGYNRGEQQYQELVREVGMRDSGNREVVEIQQRMLSEAEAAEWLEKPLKRDFAFDQMTTTYTLTKLSDSTTELRYEHRSDTTHWLLNKELVVPQIFVGISRGAHDLKRSLEGYYQRNRQLASQRP